MLKFNTKVVLHRDAEEKAKPKPLPKIVVKRSEPAVIIQRNDSEFIHAIELNKAAVQQAREEIKSELVSQSWHEHNETLLERKKLSSMIWKMVEDGATTAELREHYKKIEAYKKPLQELFDRARHVEQYGTLPEIKRDESNGQAVDINSLKYAKKKLTEKRSKLKAKIDKGKATNAPKLAEWELELDQAEAEYTHLEERIRKMEWK